jgi:hypothetical protein
MYSHCFATALSPRLFARSDLVVGTAAPLKTKIEHANGIFQLDGAWDTSNIGSGRKFVDCNERDYFTSIADNEVTWPGLAFLARFDEIWRHFSKWKDFLLLLLSVSAFGGVWLFNYQTVI